PARGGLAPSVLREACPVAGRRRAGSPEKWRHRVLVPESFAPQQWLRPCPFGAPCGRLSPIPRRTIQLSIQRAAASRWPLSARIVDASAANVNPKGRCARLAATDHPAE